MFLKLRILRYIYKPIYVFIYIIYLRQLRREDNDGYENRENHSVGDS